MTGCQWIEGEPSAEDGCKCGRPIQPIDRALDASLPQRQGLRSLPYCGAHMARAYLPRALRWLKLREFREAADAAGLDLAPLESRLATLACAAADPRDGGEGRAAVGRSRALARVRRARGSEGPLTGVAQLRSARRGPIP